MKSTLIKNATVVNEGKSEKLDVLIEGSLIKQISKKINDYPLNTIIIEAKNKVLLPGVIDE